MTWDPYQYVPGSFSYKVSCSQGTYNFNSIDNMFPPFTTAYGVSVKLVQGFSTDLGSFSQTSNLPCQSTQYWHYSCSLSASYVVTFTSVTTVQSSYTTPNISSLISSLTNATSCVPPTGWGLSLQGARVVQSTAYATSFLPTQTIAIDGLLSQPSIPLGCPAPDVSLTITYSPPDGRAFTRGVPVTGSLSSLAATVTMGTLTPSDIANRGGLWNALVSGTVSVGGSTIPLSARLSFIVSSGQGQLSVTSQGKSVPIQTYGNITSMSSPTLTVGTGRYTLSFTATGPSGTTGYTTLVVPKSLVPEGYAPTVLIDGQPASVQSYTQDSSNYYVSVDTHFSTHNLDVVFAPATNSTSTASTGLTSNGRMGAGVPPLVYALAAVAGLALVAVAVLARRRGMRPSLGRQVTAASPKMFCFHCGSKVKPGSRFCGSCGSEVPGV